MTPAVWSALRSTHSWSFVYLRISPVFLKKAKGLVFYAACTIKWICMHDAEALLSYDSRLWPSIYLSPLLRDRTERLGEGKIRGWRHRRAYLSVTRRTPGQKPPANWAVLEGSGLGVVASRDELPAGTAQLRPWLRDRRVGELRIGGRSGMSWGLEAFGEREERWKLISLISPPSKNYRMLSRVVAGFYSG